MAEKNIVIDLGGSLIIPHEIQVKFLKRFKAFILKNIKKEKRFIIITGGGFTARNYIKAISSFNVTNEDKDWIGIYATKINACLIKTIFKEKAYPLIIDKNPSSIKEALKYPIIIGSGWQPGWSTDYDAVMLAKRFNADQTIIASKIDYVYNKDVSKYKDAVPIKEISWNKYRKLIKKRWEPGMKAPVDPIAAKLAAKLKMEIIVTNGKDIKNLENILNNKKFKGTIIHS